MALFDFLFGGGDSAPPVQSSGITTTDIPSYVAEPAAQLIGAAADVASEDFVPYSGPRLVGLSQAEQDAIAQQLGYAGTGYTTAGQGIGTLQGADALLTGATDSTQSYLRQATGQGALAQNMFAQGAGGITGADIQGYINPYVTQALDPAARKLREESQRQQIANAATAAQTGSFGGSRQAVLQGVTNRSLSEGISDLYSKGYGSAYESALKAVQDDRKRQVQTGQGMANLAKTYGDLGKATTGAADSMRNIGLAEVTGAATQQTLGAADVASQLGVGALERGIDQAALDTAYSDFLKEQYYPKEQLTFMSGILQGAPYPVTTYTQATAPGQQSPGGFSQLLGFGLNAASVAGGLGWTPFG